MPAAPVDPLPTPPPGYLREGLRAPLSAVTARLLRTAVRDHALADRRRSHVPQLHVGTPGLPHEVWAGGTDLAGDHSMRADIIAAMRRTALRRIATSGTTGTDARANGPRPWVWLVRPGDLELQDLDAAWLSAARQAYAEADDQLTFVIVNRHGWWDPRSGLRRHWQRFRPRENAGGRARLTTP